MTGEPIPIVVDSRVRLPKSRLSEEVADRLKAEFTHKNPDHAKQLRENAARARRYRMKHVPPVDAPEFEPTWREEGEEHKELTFPRGGLSRVVKIVGEAGVALKFHDLRSEGTGPRPVGYRLASRVEDVRFQREMVNAALQKQNCILRGSTGCGKGTVINKLVVETGLCTLVIVQTKELFDQAIRRACMDLDLREKDVGVIRGKVERIRPITVGMVKSLAGRMDRLRGVFGLVIFDEVQRAAAKTFYPVIDACDAKYRVGLSADERRGDDKEYLNYDAFGSVAYEAHRKELIRDGFIYDVQVRLIETDFDAPWYVKLSNDAKQLPENRDRLLKQMSVDEARNKLASDIAKEEARDGHTVLVFSHRVEHCATLRSKILEGGESRVGVFVGDKLYERESEATSRGLREGTTRVACGTYQSIGTGVDVPAADRGIATTPIHSNKQGFGQNSGRLCRIDRSSDATKRDARFDVLWDRKVFGLVPLRNLLRWNDGNVVVQDPASGVLVPGREFLKREEEREDEEKLRRVL